MFSSFSHDFDDKNYALLRPIENDAFLRLQIKFSQLILYKYCINKSLLKFVFKFVIPLDSFEISAIHNKN